MPKNWKTYKLTDFIEINPKIKLMKNQEYSFVEMKDLNASNKYVLPSTKKELKGGAKFQNGDTLFARITPCLQNGKICQVKGLEDNVGFGSTEFLVLRGKANISNSDFVFYLSRSDEFRTFSEANMIGTSGRQRVAKEAFENLGLHLPPLQEQKAIASILSALDDKIELNLQQNKTLEEMAMIQFEYWFFKKQKQNWKVVKLGELIDIKGGFSYKGKFIGFGESLLLGMGCVSFIERFVMKGARQYGGDCNPNHFVRRGDIVLATRQQSDNLPILGKPALVSSLLKCNKIIVGTNLYRVQNNSSLNNNLLFQLLRSNPYQDHILSNSKGSTVKMITKDAVEEFTFSMPPENLLSKYNDVISAIAIQIEQNSVENQTLTTLRDTLLPKLISGEVRVKDIEHLVKAAL